MKRPNLENMTESKKRGFGYCKLGELPYACLISWQCCDWDAVAIFAGGL